MPSNEIPIMPYKPEEIISTSGRPTGKSRLAYQKGLGFGHGFVLQMEFEEISYNAQGQAVEQKTVWETQPMVFLDEMGQEIPAPTSGG